MWKSFEEKDVNRIVVDYRLYYDKNKKLWTYLARVKLTKTIYNMFNFIK